LKITTKTRYGLRAMMEIARETDKNGILQKDISLRQKLSLKYLDQIVTALKAAGLITNVHGKKSGYVLARPASQITMLDIHQAFEPAIQVVDCIAPTYFCEKERYCAAKSFWKGLNHLIVDYFSSFTLADMLSQQIDLETMEGILKPVVEKPLPQ
jgi:Rrf2 family protein